MFTPSLILVVNRENLAGVRGVVHVTPAPPDAVDLTCIHSREVIDMRVDERRGVQVLDAGQSPTRVQVDHDPAVSGSSGQMLCCKLNRFRPISSG